MMLLEEKNAELETLVEELQSAKSQVNCIQAFNLHFELHDDCLYDFCFPRVLNYT